MGKLKTESLGYNLKGKSLLKDITLDFQEGYLYGILGPNGSGKSTLLKLLCGIWQPSSGTVLWDNEPLLIRERKSLSKLISLVPQNPQSAFNFTVEDIVAMGRYAHNTKHRSNNETQLICNSLLIVDTLHLRKRPINQLSQGERQRVYIARALATESPILLLDEPSTSLDIKHQIAIWELMGRLAGEGKIVIATTHDLSIAENYCDQIAVLKQGRCLGKGTFKSIMPPETIEEVFGVSKMPY